MITKKEWEGLSEGGKMRYNDIIRNIENIKVLKRENDELKEKVLNEVKENGKRK